jgi:hypothetical protein
MGLWVRGVVLLTFCAFLPCHQSHADDNTQIASVPLIDPNKPGVDAPVEESDRQARLGLLLNYVRQEGPSWFPGLPSALRAPLGWASGNSSPGDAANSMMPEFLEPISNWMQEPDAAETEALWFSPGYHHMKGVMPFDDALTMGFNYRSGFLGDRVKLNVHPFYGQNWMSPQGFWGTEVALALGPDATRSWGKIVMRYDNGAPNLMGNNERGFEMGAELSFSPQLSLNAGVREDEQTQLGNYILLRWHLTNFSD